MNETGMTVYIIIQSYNPPDSCHDAGDGVDAVEVIRRPLLHSTLGRKYSHCLFYMQLPQITQDPLTQHAATSPFATSAEAAT